MWQLGIIIEISSRKELLDPIWSLPGGLGALSPLAYPLPICPARGGVLEQASCNRDLHRTLDLISWLLGIQPSAVEFLFHRLLEKGSWQKWERSF